jgi:hypothetical protein
MDSSRIPSFLAAAEHSNGAARTLVGSLLSVTVATFLSPAVFAAVVMVGNSSAWAASQPQDSGVLISEGNGRTRTVTQEEFRTMKVVRYEIWTFNTRGNRAAIYDGRTSADARRSLEEAIKADDAIRRQGGNLPPSDYSRELRRTKGPIAIIDADALRQQRADEQRKREEEEKRRQESERKRQADAKAAAERQREAEEAQRKARAEVDRKRYEAEQARMRAENARRNREAAEERTREARAALSRAQAIQNSGDIWSRAIQDAGNLILEEMERDAAEEAERDARQHEARLQELAERAAYEERKAQERLEERRELDSIRESNFQEPEEYQTDDFGLRVKPQGAPEPPPVFPTATQRPSFNYGALAGGGGEDSDGGRASDSSGGGSLASAIMRSFGRSDDRSADSTFRGDGDESGDSDADGGSAPASGSTSALRRLFGGGGDEDSGQPEASPPQGGSALRRLFGSRGSGDGDAGTDDARAGDAADQQPSALDRLASRFRAGADRASEGVADARRKMEEWRQEVRSKAPENWRDSFVIWLVSNRYELERNARVFGPDAAKSMNRMGYVNTASNVAIGAAGDQIPIEAREAYFRHRILLGWLTRDASGTANAYKDYVDKMFIEQLPDPKSDDEQKEVEERR